MSAAPSAPGRRNVAVRPKKPPPSPFLVWGSLGLTVTTLVLGSDWAYGIGFSLGDIYDNLGRYNPVVDGIRNLDGGTLASPRVISGFVETFQMAAIATVLGGIVALPVAVLSSVTGAPNTFVYVVVKNISGFIRAIPDLIYAVFFVAAVGRGALPGVLAPDRAGPRVGRCGYIAGDHGHHHVDRGHHQWPPAATDHPRTGPRHRHRRRPRSAARRDRSAWTDPEGRWSHR